MKTLFTALLLTLPLALCAAEKVSLSDGKTFKGWEGDTNKTWRIEDGAFVGGSLKARVPRNEFLRSTRPYTNFVLRLKFKLVGPTPAPTSTAACRSAASRRKIRRAKWSATSVTWGQAGGARSTMSRAATGR